MHKKHREEKWVEREFGEVELGDKRRTQRLKRIVMNCASKPQGSVVESSGDWAEAKAAYRFYDTEIEPEELTRGHEKRTRERMGGRAVVLAVQDTTTLNYSSHGETSGLGSIGTRGSGCQGYFCHATLAVDEEGEVLGLLQALSYRREEKVAARRRGPAAPEAESRRWLESLEACEKARLENGQTLVVSVADRECDFYEFFAAASRKAPGVEVLVRAKHDRKLATGFLSEKIGSAPVSALRKIEVPKQGERAAREACLEVRFCPVELGAPPHWKKSEEAGPPLGLWLVQVEESGEDPQRISWRLLTTVPVESQEQAQKIVDWYVLRWKIEVFFHILKSGCKVEERQLETRERLERALRIDLVVAWRVFSLMSQARAHPDHEADLVLDPAQWQALACFQSQTRTPPASPPKLAAALLSIAKLGGFLARKSDGPPGPAVIWRGLRRLDDITLAWLAFGR